MTKRSRIHWPVWEHGRAGAVLAVFFLLGLIFGTLAAGSAGAFFLSAMRAVAGSHVSFMGLLSSLVPPFLFSAFAVYLGRPLLLVPIAFWKAFLFSYLVSGLFSAWGSAGWLITALVMSGRICALPLLWWYWLRHIRGRRFEPGVFCLILGSLILIGILEFHLIAPFLGTITNF